MEQPTQGATGLVFFVCLFADAWNDGDLERIHRKGRRAAWTVGRLGRFEEECDRYGLHANREKHWAPYGCVRNARSELRQIE